VAFELDHYLVRGLDYYNRTVFEFVASLGLGAQNAVAAGGRYDGLFLTLGNKIDLPAIGCAGGMERIALLLGEQTQIDTGRIQISLIGADDPGYRLAMDLAFKLRKNNIAADFALVKKSTKAQMRRADKLGARFAAVLGEQEMMKGKVMIKGLRSDINRELKLDHQVIADFLSSLAKG
jgi:histidyl-tRNA synthetase